MRVKEMRVDNNTSQHSSSSSDPSNNNNKKKHHHHLLLSDCTRREKLKGSKRRRGGIMSLDVEDEPTRTKFKLPNKISCDSNHPINPASVPRKLRSAISKRNCQSGSAFSLDSKRMKCSINGVESLRKDCLKKFKNGCAEGSPGSAASVAISKEEEEVAETLFALAGLIPLKGETSEAKAIGSTKNKNDDPISSSKDPVILKAELEPACKHSSSEGRSVKPDPSESLQETPPLSWPKLSERRQFNPSLKVSVPPSHFPTIPPLLKACDERKLGDSASTFHIPTAPIRQRGFNETNPEKVFHSQVQHGVSLQLVDLFSNRERKHATPSESQRMDNGLMSRALLVPGVDQHPTQSSATIFPSWLHTSASSSRPGSCADTVALDKVPSSAIGSRKSWKRCMLHVHISRLIQVMQMSERKDNGPLDASHLRASQFSSVPPGRNEGKGNLSSHNFGSAAYNKCETGVRVRMNVQNHMDTAESSNKRSFDFLSLSSGVGAEANNSANRLSNCMNATNQLPPPQSVPQASSSQVCSTSDNPFPSNAFGDQVAVASMALPHQLHLQMPPYFANAFGSAHMSSSKNVSSMQSAQPKSQQQQQQQQIWTTQLAAQFRPGPLLASQIANWQNRRQDPRFLSNHIQPQLPHAQSSLEMMGAKYLHISQQQQQLVGLCPPLPLSSSKHQNSQLPSNCEDKGGRFRPDGVMPFQLLCNERL